MDESFLHINKNSLDTEWENQPVLMYQYGERLAKAERKEAEAKAEVDVTFSRLQKTVRANPDRFGIARISEAAIESAVLLDKEYQEAKQNLSDASYEVGIYKAAVRALEHRKKALEKLVELFFADYYSTPRSSNVNAKEWDKKSARTSGRRRKDDEERSTDVEDEELL